ncbi:universal stress protein [Actinophytocola sp. NPDC049390]|uniref:universal stress protein n=1 Tax=Actinophytocola sp. NPDC049390 TaxID=3363894 RepID=UPI0037B92226
MAVPPVVVGVDGSESALDAVRWAADEARRRETLLRIVHAYQIPTGYPQGFVDVKMLHDVLLAQGKEWLVRAQEVAEEAAPGLTVETVGVQAPTVPALEREARDAAVLVLGSRGLGGFTGLLIGSTAVTLVTRAACPIVVVREPGRDGPVVVGVDGTPASEAAIAFAFAEASARDAELVAVHVWSDLLLEVAFAGEPAMLDVTRLAEEAHGVLGERLAGWQEQYPDVVVTREVVRDRATRALLRRAEGARLVVVGSRGRGGFRGLMLGSTSQHLLYHAACPVAVVPARPE